MRRRLFTTLSILSLLLCMASVYLWLRTLRQMDVVGRLSPSGHGHALLTMPHCLRVASCSTAGDFVALFTRGPLPRWIVFSVPYDVPQKVNLELGHQQALVGSGVSGRADVTFTIHRSSNGAGVLGFQLGASDNQAPSSISVEITFSLLNALDINAWDEASLAAAPPIIPPVPAGWEFTVPFWFLVSTTAVLPLLRICGAVRRRRRLRLGLCTTCAYDLRASTERCPECGTSIPPNPHAQIGC